MTAIAKTIKNSGNGTSPGITVPADWVIPGKVLLWVLSSRNNGTITPPDGSWTQVAARTAANHGSYVFAKVADGSENDTSLVFTDSKTGRKAFQLIQTNNDSIDQIAISATVITGTEVAQPVVTASGAGDIIYLFFASDFDGTTEDIDSFDPAGSGDEEVSYAATSSAYVGAGEAVQASAGSTPTINSTSTVSGLLSACTIVLTAGVENPVLSEICFRPLTGEYDGTIYPDGTVIKYSIFADADAIGTGDVLAAGSAAIAGGEGYLTLDHDELESGSSYHLVGIDPDGNMLADTATAVDGNA